MKDLGKWFIGVAVLATLGAVVYVKTAGAGFQASNQGRIPKQTYGHVNILQSGEVVPYSAQVKAAQTTAQPRPYVNVCGMKDVVCF